MPHVTVPNRTKYFRGSPQRLTIKHLKPTNTHTESLHGTDGQEKNPCDEARDYWENREGRWVRVHSIARRTLFDPMHDEQPFCQNLTERRRTTVRFLGQHSEMMIDDTWPQAGEMRSLWKGTTEFWTDDMPQDDTWEANRHHSHILPLFRSHLTRDTAAMFPSLQNTVTSTEHECRDPHLPAVSHTENAEEEGDAWFWCCQNYTACTAPTTTPPVPQNLNDRIPAKGCRRLLVRPRVKGTGKGNTCQLCGAIISDKGEITETNKAIQRKLVLSKEEK